MSEHGTGRHVGVSARCLHAQKGSKFLNASRRPSIFFIFFNPSYRRYSGVCPSGWKKKSDPTCTCCSKLDKPGGTHASVNAMMSPTLAASSADGLVSLRTVSPDDGRSTRFHRHPSVGSTRTLFSGLRVLSGFGNNPNALRNASFLSIFA